MEKGKIVSIDPVLLEKLKKENPGGLYAGSISFTDSEDEAHEVEFFYRKPSTADVEAHAKAQQRNPIIANLNLIQSLIVHPEPGPVIDAIRDYPMTYSRFVDEAVSPFFGANITVRSRKL
jgi:hypothetical protein